jgi:hypothetical protein
MLTPCLLQIAISAPSIAIVIIIPVQIPPAVRVMGATFLSFFILENNFI